MLLCFWGTGILFVTNTFLPGGNPPSLCWIISKWWIYSVKECSASWEAARDLSNLEFGEEVDLQTKDHSKEKRKEEKNQNKNIKLTGGVTSKAHKKRAWDQLTRSRRGSGISWRIWDGSPLGLVSSCPLFTTKKTRFYLGEKNQLLRSSTVVYSCNPRIWETKKEGGTLRVQG